MFSLIGAVEKAGSGADTIMLGWKDGNFDTPTITEKSEPNKVELTLPIVPVTSNDGIHDTNDFNGVNGVLTQSSPKFPNPLDQFLKILRIFPYATVAILAKEADVSERMVKKYIKELRTSNIIRRVGSNRKGYWVITEPTEIKNNSD